MEISNMMLQKCNKTAAKHPFESIGRKRVKEPNLSLEGTSQPLKEGRTTVPSELENGAAALKPGLPGGKDPVLPALCEATDSIGASEAAFELWQAREQIKEKDDVICKLKIENDRLSLQVKDFCKKTLQQEEKTLKFEKENDQLTSNVQNLKQEVEEVKDTFREDTELEEYSRHLKKELLVEAKNCRSLQFKLRKAERSILAIPSGDKKGPEVVGVEVKSALDIMNQIKQLNTDNVLIINSLLNTKRVS